MPEWVSELAAVFGAFAGAFVASLVGRNKLGKVERGVRAIAAHFGMELTSPGRPIPRPDDDPTNPDRRRQ